MPDEAVALSMLQSRAAPEGRALEDLELREVIERIGMELYATFVLRLLPNPSRYPPT
jgi:hypothetical protein